MNVPVHLSDQISGQLCNQVGTQLPGLSQPNLNAVHSQVPAMGGQHEMNHEVLKARRYMIQKIYSYLISRQPQGQEIHQRRIADLAKQFEAFLFQSAVTMEEYVNLDTLEHRLCMFPRNHRHQFPQPVNSIGKMIPTTGMSHHASSNLNVTSSVDTSRVAASICNTITSTNADGGNILSTGNGSSMIHGGSYSSFVGKFSNGYQQSPSKVSMSSGNNIFSSLGVQRIGSQMMPGFVNSKNNNQSYMNMGASNTGGFSTVNSTIFSETQQQKQQASGQSSHILCNLGRQIGGGISSAQKPYAFSNGSLNGEVGMVGGNSKLVNVSGTSEGYFTGTHYVNSSKSLPQHFDQLQESSMEGDIYRMGFSNPSGAGNFGGPVLSVGSVMNLKSLNAVNLHGMSKAGSRLIADELNLHNKQHSANVKPQSMDLSEKMNCSSQLSPKENFLQSYQKKQLLQQQHPHEFQEQQQFVPHISQQNDTFGKLPLASDLGNKDVEARNEVLQQLQLSQLQNQLQQKSAEEHTVGAQMQSLSTNQLSTYSSSCQISQPMQQYLHPHQFVTEPQIQNGSSSVTVQSETGMQEQWSPLSQNISVMSNEQHLQEVSRHRIMGQYGTGRDEFSSKGSIIGESIASKGTVGIPIASGDTWRSTSINRKLQFLNQQRWLLFMLHARRCMEPEGKCLEPHCIDVQRLWRHIESCKLSLCSTPRCRLSRSLFSHYKHCCHPGCPVCVPVKTFVRRHYRVNTDSGLVLSTSVTCTSDNTEGHLARILVSKSCPSIAETSDDLQPSAKRLKTEPHFHSLIPKVESSMVSVPVIHETHMSQNVLSEENPQLSRHGSLKSEFTNDTVKIPLSIGQLSPNSSKMKDNNSDLNAKRLDDESACFANQEMVVHEKETDQVKRENVAVAAEPAKGIMCGKPKIKGVSLIEFFTPEQIQQHIRGLRLWIGQSKTKAEKNQAMEHSMSESCCQLCAVEKLYFEPPPIYCARCGVRIKQNAMYYTMGTGDSRHYFCIHCYSKSPGDAILADGAAVPKANLQKMKNDKQTEEGWVQCDKCEAWQHQICTLFNSRRNDGGQAEYTCPNCCIDEVERGERKPLPENAVLGAKDLPKTLLSDHIEERLFKGLKQERLERARIQGKTFDEVPGAEALVVRVVSSVDKKLEVKQRFLEMFQEENYPTEFPYKSKKIEGVEVCLFGMYVQEFGSECRFPNQRRVYLSYLDSVKYFRPEIKAVSGEALRTFVYHEILIGYLDYCKKRGFTSCYIWACPPLKGEDYILYCHPEIQKTPKSEKLRDWYLSMLKKAAKENIAVDLTNMYDHFFISKGDCKAKVTAARLPYFDGDYWPGTAEDMINELQQEEDGRKLNKKVTTKKTVSKRALKASGQTDMYGNASKDLLLMHRLGATISPMKEDFIMVHLQHACTHCCRLMVSGNRWTCDQCKKFQLCDSCYATEQKLEERERHPTNQKDKHVLYKVEINNVPVDTKDKDEILESEFFDTRQAFLSLCQGNHYQYDTLRRAKHSSMMILYHLHNPTAPAFVTTCYKCHLDIETGQGWHCETCPDYDVCNACYQKDGGIDHPHTLTNHPSVVDGDVQNKEARQLRVLQHRKMLDLLVHASQCPSPQCQYPNCRKVKGLFRHGIQCRRRASGGCVLCKKMWYLLKLHARACKNPECQVPRCRDLREHMRRLQHQSDSRRRAAVKEMMRQRAAEVASNSG